MDVTDIESEDGMISVFTPVSDYYKARQALLDKFEGIAFEVDEMQFLPQTTISLEAEDQAQYERLLDMLNYLDDVQNVYTNVQPD